VVVFFVYRSARARRYNARFCRALASECFRVIPWLMGLVSASLVAVMKCEVMK
jgi:hypothetical protein